MHRKKRQVHPDKAGPEMDLAPSLIVLAAGHFPDPVIETGKDRENGA